MCGSSRNSVEQLPPATTELVVFGTLSFGQVEGQESICCPSPAQSFPLLDRERRENFLGLYFMVVGIKSFCLSFPSGQQGWQLKHKVHRCGSGLCPGTFPHLTPGLAFSLEGLVTRLMSGFGSGWKQSGLLCARIPASKMNPTGEKVPGLTKD